jgi:hypothetical protein
MIYGVNEEVVLLGKITDNVKPYLNLDELTMK